MTTPTAMHAGTLRADPHTYNGKGPGDEPGPEIQNLTGTKIVTNSTPTPDSIPEPSEFSVESARRGPLEPPAYLRDLDRDTPADLAEAQRRAIAYPCGVPGCNGQSHDPDDDPAEFIHTLERIEAGRLRIEVYVPGWRDKVHVDAYIAGMNGSDLTTENELRALAAELRSYARIIERQTNALELHTAAFNRSVKP